MEKENIDNTIYKLKYRKVDIYTRDKESKNKSTIISEYDKVCTRIQNRIERIQKE